MSRDHSSAPTGQPFPAPDLTAGRKTGRSTSLKPVELHLLLALADAPMHGYALAQRMAAESEGQVQMLPGNLYAVIRRLERAGMVAPAPTADTADRRRRCFALTPQGQRVLGSEIRRLERMVGLGLARLPDAEHLEAECQRSRSARAAGEVESRVQTGRLEAGIEEPEVAT